jgi:hypothetical protein
VIVNDMYIYIRHLLERDSARIDRDGFRGLWRRVKPVDKPDEVGH